METNNNNEEVPSAAVSEEKKLKLHELAKQGDLEAMKAAVGDGENEWNAVDESGMNLLHVAAMNGQDSVVGWLLSETGGRAAGFEQSVLAKTKEGNTALHVAAWKGHLECVQAIVDGCKVENGERGRMLNEIDDEKWTALHYAVLNGHASMITWLLSDSGGRAAGFNLGVLSNGEGECNAIHLAACEGHLKCVQALAEGCTIEERKVLLNDASESGSTVLHIAAFHGHASIISWLLSDCGGRAAGFEHSVLAKRKEGSTALHAAARKGHLQCMQALVEGCKIEERELLLNGVTNIGWTVLHIAAVKGHVSIIRWLLSDSGGRAAGFEDVLAKSEDGCNAVHLAAWKGHLECIQALVEGCKIEEREQLINSVSDDNWTMLHSMVSFNQVTVLQWLLSDCGGRAAGFEYSVLVKSKEGSTALHAAARKGHLQCMQALVEGCKIEERELLLNGVTNIGWTVLHIAASNGHASIIRWLLSDSGGRAAGFEDVLAKSEDGCNAVHLAAWKGHLECIQALVEGCKSEEREALLNEVSKGDMTVLHFASSEGHVSIISWLLSDSGGRAAGFNKVLSKDEEGRNTTHRAAEKGYLECVDAIVDGCKVENGERAKMINDIDNEKWTVLHYAARFGHPLIIRRLLSDCGGRSAGFHGVLSKEDNGCNALHLAAAEGHMECVQALVEGCKMENGERSKMINEVSNEKWTVLHIAARHRQPSITSWLLSESGREAGLKHGILAKDVEGMTALRHAAGEGHLDCIQALVEGCKHSAHREKLLNDFDAVAGSILHEAAYRGRPSIITWLLSEKGRAAGFKLGVLEKDGDGKTALHDAAEEGHLSCIEALAEGCKTNPEELRQLLNAKDNYGWTALHSAAESDDPSTMSWFLSDSGGRAAGFGVTKIAATRNDMRSILHSSVQNGKVQALHHLLSGCTASERLTLLHPQDKQHGWTVLHEAARFGKADVIRELMCYAETQSITSIRDHRGLSALHRAVIGGVDGKSRAEWAEGVFVPFDREEVVSALLSMVQDKEEDDDETKKNKKRKREKEEEEVPLMDVNLGIKFF